MLSVNCLSIRRKNWFFRHKKEIVECLPFGGMEQRKTRNGGGEERER